MFTKNQFENHIWKVVEKNTAKVASILSQGEGTFDAFNLMNRFTLDTIGEIGFSKDVGSLQDPSSPFLQSFDFAQSALLKRFWTGNGVPVWKFFRFFGLYWEKEMPMH